MWMITYHVIPKPRTPAFADCGGAYVNCFIVHASQEGAEQIATFEVEKEWSILTLEEISWFEDDYDFPTDDPRREYFEEALVDGSIFVFHEYPIGADEEDDVGISDINDLTGTEPKLSH